MFGIGNKNKRKQNCLLLTEDDRMLDIKLDVVKEYVADHKTTEAWGLIPDACIQERGTNKSFLVITERDCAPVSLNGQNYSKKMKSIMSQIAQENASAARASIQRKAQKNKVAETLQLLAIIFGIFLCLLVLLGLFTSGKLHLPGGGDNGGGIFGFIPIWFKMVI